MKKTKPRYYAVLAMTLDGFIAKEEGQVSTSWTSKEDKRHLHKMEEEADVLLMASKSYNLVEKKLRNFNSIVLTRKVNSIKHEHEKLILLNTNAINLEEYIKKHGYKNVCVLGGRVAYNYCLKKNLLDDIYITIEPIIFGNGLTAFNKPISEKRFNLVSFKRFNENGTILLHYSRE